MADNEESRHAELPEEALLNKNSEGAQSYKLPNVNRSSSVDHEDVVPALETLDEKRMRRKSHFVVYLTIFNMSIGFSIVLTGVWPYLKKLDPSASKEFLGWVVAANPLGQMLAAPVLGWCGNKVGSNRGAFLVTIAMFIIGNVLYALLPLVKQHVKYIMMLSRFIVGVSSANIAICRSYIAASTKMRERTAAMSITAAAQAMGFILGPSIQTLTAYAYDESDALVNKTIETAFSGTGGTPVNETLLESRHKVVVDNPGSSALVKKLHGDITMPLINMYTLAAWLVVFLGLMNLFLFLPCIYKEFYISLREARRQCKADGDGDIHHIKHDYTAIVVVIVTFFNVLVVYVLVETLIVPMCLDMYAWTSEYAVKVAGIGLTIAGVLSLVMFLLSGKLANMFNDRKVCIFMGLIPLTVAMLVFLPFGKNYPKIKQCDAIAETNSVFHSDNSTDFIVGSSNTSKFVSNSSNFDDGTDFHNFPTTSSVEGDCDGVGCPSSQKWCFYTPIIELPQFVGASVLATIGYPVVVSISSAIYSKLLSPAVQGLWMGVLTSAGGLSRVVGPIYVTYMYTSHGLYWTFGSLFVLLFVTFILNCVFYKRLQPVSFHPKDQSLSQNGILSEQIG